MELIFDDKVILDVVFGSDDEEEKKVVEFLKVELVLNVLFIEDSGKI